MNKNRLIEEDTKSVVKKFKDDKIRPLQPPPCPSSDNIMEKLDDKFIVFNKKHLNELSIELKKDIKDALEIIQKYFPKNKYIVCNQDEIYAEEIAKIILKGENKL